VVRLEQHGVTSSLGAFACERGMLRYQFRRRVLSLSSKTMT
jgi:hypothetical protein